MLDLLIHNASTPHGMTDIGVSEGRIVQLHPAISEGAREIIDATNLQVWPGIIDAHLHFNEPGRTEWEGIATGSRALAAGGGTTYFDMPLNAHPPTVDLASFEMKHALALEKSVVDFGLWGGLVPGNADDMEPLAAAGVIGFKAFMSETGTPDFQRSGEPVLREGIKRAAALGLPVAVHAEDNELVNRLSAEAMAAGKITPADYLASRPVEAELNAIETAINLAGEFGCKLHIVHVSSPEGLAKIAAARQRGVDVTAETCPHYLLFTCEDVERIGPSAKCAPPIRDPERNRLLWQNLASGLIQTIGSDHSPSPGSMKVGDNFFKLWGGIAGCQHAFPLFIARAMEDEGIDPSLLTSVLSGNVAERFGIAASKGSIAIGKDADFTFLQKGVSEVIAEEMLLYRHAISPYLGSTLRTSVVRTITRGQTVWNDGRIASEPGRAKFIRPDQSASLRSVDEISYKPNEFVTCSRR